MDRKTFTPTDATTRKVVVVSIDDDRPAGRPVAPDAPSWRHCLGTVQWWSSVVLLNRAGISILDRLHMQSGTNQTKRLPALHCCTAQHSKHLSATVGTHAAAPHSTYVCAFSFLQNMHQIIEILGGYLVYI